MRELAKQQPQLRNGRTLAGAVGCGGRSQFRSGGYSQNFENLKRDGAPVDWVALDPVYGNLNPMGLVGESRRTRTRQSCSSILFCRKPGKKPFARNGACQTHRRFARSAETGSRIFRGFHRRSGLREL